MNSVGPISPRSSWIPARQRLETRDFARLEVDERLIEEPQLVLVERAAKFGLDREAAPGFGRLLGLIDLRASRPPSPA